MKRVKEKFYIELNRFVSFFRTKKKGPIFYDKFYPSQAYKWRTTEFNFLLEKFPKAILYAEANNYKGHTTKKKFLELIDDLKVSYPKIGIERQIKYLNKPVFLYNFKAPLVYFLFLEDAIRFYPFLFRMKTPFVFTLYPGGGFLIDNPIIDEKIQLICNSTLCKGVIVNGKFAHNYLTKKLKISESTVHLIPGVPLELNELKVRTHNKNGNFIIGFCARKYLDRGLDKGFDIFAQLAHHYQNVKDVEFICIGDFSKNDLLQEEKELINIKFTGLLSGEDFLSTISTFDVIVSPVRHFLNGGDFDGFPTAAVVEASLQGVTMVCSDPLNDSFYSKDEIIIAEPEINAYIEILEKLRSDLQYCHKIGLQGQRKTFDLYNLENTLLPKYELLKSLIDEKEK